MNTSPLKNSVRFRGMVLLEVMIALTIFAVVSLGLVTALDTSLDAAKDRNAADRVQRGLANELVLFHTQRLVPGERDLPDDGSGLHYHLAVAPEPMLDQRKQPVNGIYRATITASWKESGHAETRDISELVYQP